MESLRSFEVQIEDAEIGGRIWGKPTLTISMLVAHKVHTAYKSKPNIKMIATISSANSIPQFKPQTNIGKMKK